jgi:hypothetical protein
MVSFGRYEVLSVEEEGYLDFGGFSILPMILGLISILLGAVPTG